MRRADREVRSRVEIDAIVHDAPYCTMAMCVEGQPYTVPLTFGYDGVAVYLHCAPKGRKLEFLQRNPRVSLCFVGKCRVELAEPACGSSTRYASVIAEGIARLVDDPAAKAHALDAIMAQQGAQGPHEYDERTLARTTVISVEIVGITGKRRD
jgi:nitroimidazol reductase NimA-like FMN-containing flavoprotein (pyridoxamine 5'-phosphate oxidase superfamily)